MSFSFVVPVLALLAVTIVIGVARWPLPNEVAVRTLAIVAAVTASTVAALALVAVAGFALGPARRTELVGWCRIVPLHHEVGPALGTLSGVALVAMVVRVTRVLHVRRQATEGTAGRRIAILDTDRPVAYAAPGNPGCVVVSTGLLSALEPPERRVLFAHERAHLRQRHHRYLLLGALAVAIVPLLSPLVDRLRLATERCADEAAVAAVSGDRRLVATAIAKAAATTSHYDGLVPGFNGGSIVERVNALVGAPPSAARIRLGQISMATGVFVAVAAGSVQFHHLWSLADHVCRG